MRETVKQLRGMGRILILGGTVSAASVGLAGGFWLDKPYAQWSEKEVSKLMSSSPWSRSVAIRLTTQDLGGGFAGEEGSGPGGEEGGRASVVVTWSSRTVRMAQVRRRQLGGAAADPEAEKALIDIGGTDSYVLVVQAPGLGAMKSATEAQLMESAALLVGKKKAARTLKPTKVVKPSEGGGFVALLYFPRGDTPVAESEAEATFSVRLGKYPVEPVFELGAMRVGDTLDLQ